MPTLYQLNRLLVADVTTNGVLLDAGEFDVLSLANAPDDVKAGDTLEVFLYRDSADGVAATLSIPRVQVGECAYLKAVSVRGRSAFLDWGLPKDLLLPSTEQTYPVREGNSYVVHVFLDNNGRAMATTKLYDHLDEFAGDLQVGEAVDLLISGESELGFKAVINHQHLGLIYHNELSQPLRFGTRMKGWIKAIRDDGKIDLNINVLAREDRDQLEALILEKLQQADGRLELSDKSSPGAIFRVFKVSKKNFKRALGSLYKQQLIRISEDFIERV